ncbi:MAG: VOC family protein [Microcoleaceae cyanobacterium]
MMSNCQAAFVTLADPNIERLVAFYTQLLAIQPQTLIAHSYAEFQLPGLRLGIFQPKPDQASEFSHQTHTGMSLCLEVVELEAAIGLMQKLGCPPPGKIITASHGREIYGYDPAGNRIILHQSIEIKK